MEIKGEVLQYLEDQSPLTGSDETEKLSCRYLDMGLIDSFGIILMVEEFERRFGIHFSSEDLQSEDFQTPGGLIQLIKRLRTDT